MHGSHCISAFIWTEHSGPKCVSKKTKTLHGLSWVFDIKLIHLDSRMDGVAAISSIVRNDDHSPAHSTNTLECVALQWDAMDLKISRAFDWRCNIRSEAEKALKWPQTCEPMHIVMMTPGLLRKSCQEQQSVGKMTTSTLKFDAELKIHIWQYPHSQVCNNTLTKWASLNGIKGRDHMFLKDWPDFGCGHWRCSSHFNPQRVAHI